MTAGSQPPATYRRIGILLMLLPFVLLSLVGQGVMPQRTAQGITLVLCSVDGLVEVTLDPATGAPVPGTPDPHCDWSTAQVLALTALPATFAPPVTLRPVEPARETPVHRPAHDPRGLFARGPPALS
jgi:hypothetical protein